MSLLRSPVQERSQASLARIVSAARGLLEEQGFEQLTVARIAKEARSSVGVFYSRFADKGALLEHLAEVYAEQAHAEVRAFAAGRDGSAALADEVRAVVRFVVRFHRERAGWIRALLQEARGRPGGRIAERMGRLKALPPSLARGLLAHRGRIGHPDPARAVAEGFFLVLSGVREHVLFGEGALDDADLTELLTRAWLAILTPVR